MSALDDFSLESQWNELKALSALARAPPKDFNSNPVRKNSVINVERQAIIAEQKTILMQHKHQTDLEADLETILKRREQTEDETKKLVETISELKSATKQILEETEEKRPKVAVLKQKLDSMEGQWGTEKQKLEHYINMAKDHLGLEIRPCKSPDSNRLIVFSNLDKNDPDRKFMCEIVLEVGDDGKQKYSVVRTLPQLTDMDAMVAILNKTGDLSGFSVKLREKFKSLI